jgi:hypothetical protein
MKEFIELYNLKKDILPNLIDINWVDPHILNKFISDNDFLEYINPPKHYKEVFSEGLTYYQKETNYILIIRQDYMPKWGILFKSFGDFENTCVTRRLQILVCNDSLGTIIK